MDINSAIKKGFFQQVRFLVRFGHSVDKRDEAGRTPLINSAFVEDERWAVGLARNLIESGARVGVTDRAGVNALHYACMLGRTGLVQIFLKAIDYDLNQPDRWDTQFTICICVNNLYFVFTCSMELTENYTSLLMLSNHGMFLTYFRVCVYDL